METHLLRLLRKFILPEIVYGPGALQLAGQHVGNFGGTKVLLVTDEGVVQAGWSRRVAASLAAAGIAHVVFDAVTPNPKDHEVMRGAARNTQEDCDLILAVGGGSPMDAAKGIGVVVGNGGHILDYEGVDAVPNPGPPLRTGSASGAGSVPAAEPERQANVGQGKQGRSGVAPSDIPDGQGDDIVARQIREAAENESDPELREKLWEEYRKYKQSGGA